VPVDVVAVFVGNYKNLHGRGDLEFDRLLGLGQIGLRPGKGKACKMQEEVFPIIDETWAALLGV
jgi:hypothetical protein